MLNRCYSENLHARKPQYKDCSVCAEWLIFSNFKVWMETQDWQGKELDKDLLVSGNKLYSPITCLFLDRATNQFITDTRAGKYNLPPGVSWHKNRCKYVASCKNTFTKRLEYLGSFDAPNQAHLAWKRRKHELACQLADMQTDARVANALRTRYL